jgi:hypothetical protein
LLQHQHSRNPFPHTSDFLDTILPVVSPSTYFFKFFVKFRELVFKQSTVLSAPRAYLETIPRDIDQISFLDLNGLRIAKLAAPER